MQKWEYRSVYVALIDERDMDTHVGNILDCRSLWQELLEKELAKYGEQGWELVAMPERLLEGEGVDGYVMFKRTKEE